MQKNLDELTIGVLDIYGFEIFQVDFSNYFFGGSMLELGIIDISLC